MKWAGVVPVKTGRQMEVARLFSLPFYMSGCMALDSLKFVEMGSLGA